MCLILLKHILSSTRLLIWMHERNTIKLHVQVFLRMNTWMFETCRRHYNYIKTWIKMYAFCWFLLHAYITMNRSKKTDNLSNSVRFRNFSHQNAYSCVWEITKLIIYEHNGEFSLGVAGTHVAEGRRDSPYMVCQRHSHLLDVLPLPKRILGSLYNLRSTHFIQVDIP